MYTLMWFKVSWRIFHAQNECWRLRPPATLSVKNIIRLKALKRIFDFILRLLDKLYEQYKAFHVYYWDCNAILNAIIGKCFYPKNIFQDFLSNNLFLWARNLRLRRPFFVDFSWFCFVYLTKPRKAIISSKQLGTTMMWKARVS